MFISINTPYVVSPSSKKSVLSTEEYTDGRGNMVTVETVWRRGEFVITPRTMDEVNLLAMAADNKDDQDAVLNLDDFEDVDVVEYFDDCGNDYHIDVADDDLYDKIDSLLDSDGTELLEDVGFIYDNTMYELIGPLDIEAEVVDVAVV